MYRSPTSLAPVAVATTSTSSAFAALVTLGNNSAASTVRLPSTLARAYSNFSCTAIATFAGSVHGVVVQIMKLGVACRSRSSRSSSESPNAAKIASASAPSKSTYTDRSSRSSYSSSASARAVSLAIDQCTGLSAL